jgi:hypothetical protein
MAANAADLLRKKKSNFSTTLSAWINDTDETIACNSLSGLPEDTAVTLTIDRVDDAGTVKASNLWERVTGVVSGNNLTNCLRGEDGTSAQAHSSGAVVEDIWDAETWNDMVDAFLVGHTQAGAHSLDSLTAKTTNTDLTLAGNGTGKVKANASYGAITTATPEAAATATLNLATSNKHNIIMPAGNITIALSNAAVGQVFTIRILQDGTGSRTVTWFTTIRWAGGSAPTLTTTASKADIFAFVVTGAGTYDGFVVGANI